MSRNNSITITRIIAMLMIILCHWFRQIPALSQLFNVGVTIFFFISGYVYSEKIIPNYKKFFAKRWVKLYIPCYVLALYLFLTNLIKSGSCDFKALFFGIVNINGFEFIFMDLNIPEYGPWFITVIMLCYVQLMLHKKYEEKHGRAYLSNPLYLIALVVLQIVLISVAHIQIAYFMTFLMGYVWGDKKRDINLKSYAGYTALMLLGMAARLGTRAYLGDVLWYGEILVFYTHFTLALWIFMSISYAQTLFRGIFERIAKSRFVKMLDEVSLFVYLAHGIPLCFIYERYNTWYGLIITVILSVIAGWILKMITDLITRFCRLEKLYS